MVAKKVSRANIRYVKHPSFTNIRTQIKIMEKMTLEFQIQDVVRLTDSNLAYSRFEVAG